MQALMNDDHYFSSILTNAQISVKILNIVFIKTSEASKGLICSSTQQK